MNIKIASTLFAGLCVFAGLAYAYKSMTASNVGVITDATYAVAAFVLALVVLKVGEMWSD